MSSISSVSSVRSSISQTKSSTSHSAKSTKNSNASNSSKETASSSSKVNSSSSADESKKSSSASGESTNTSKGTTEKENLTSKLETAIMTEILDQIKNDDPHFPQAKHGEYDIKKLGEVVDNVMMSDELQEEMNYISGTDGNDNITSSINKENGNIIINVNGEAKEYTPEEAANGFKIDLGDGNDNLDLSAILNNFVIDAGEGDNNINLSQGINILSTGNGNNTINSTNAERNNITTGNGNNKIKIDSSDNTKSLMSTVHTGSGIDRISANGNTEIYSGAGNDLITTTGDKNYIDAESGNDIIFSKGSEDEIHGGNGNDIIIARGDNEFIYGDNGNDKIRVGNTNNNIIGGKGNDSIIAGNGNNNIYGLDGDDKIRVGNGNNYIDGGKNNDNITVGKGSNIIFGGLGDDTINAKKSSGVIFDDKNGGTINASENINVNRYDSSKNTNLGSSIKIEGNDNFKEILKSDLEALRATESGRKLLSELDKSGHTVTIEEINKNIKNSYADINRDNKNDEEISQEINKRTITPDGQRGEGTDAKIGYNPYFREDDKGFMPLNVLFHEGVHAYNITTGTMQPGTQEQENGSLVAKTERQTVGISIKDGIEVTHPDGTVTAGNPEKLTENSIRAELGIDRREIY